jgi:hypothetical protein
LSFDFGHSRDTAGFEGFRRIARILKTLDKMGRITHLFGRTVRAGEGDRGLSEDEMQALADCVSTWDNLVRESDKPSARDALLAAQRLEDAAEVLRSRLHPSSSLSLVALIEEIVFDTRALALEVLKTSGPGVFEKEPLLEDEEDEELRELYEPDLEGMEAEEDVREETLASEPKIEFKGPEPDREDAIDKFRVFRELSGNEYFHRPRTTDSEILDAEERKSQTWNAILPGIVPRIHRLDDVSGKQAEARRYVCQSLLDLVRAEGAGQVTAATSRLMCTLDEVWHKTVRDERVRTEYVEEILRSLETIYELSPELSKLSLDEILKGGGTPPSLQDLLEHARDLESSVAPVKAVYVHGALTLQRVYYDQERDRVLLLDVERSRFGDYLQDVHALVASSDTLDGVSGLSRALSREINVSMLSLAERFASEIEDQGFQRRIHLSGASALLSAIARGGREEGTRDLFLQAVRTLGRLLEMDDPSSTDGEQEKPEDPRGEHGQIQV